MISRRMLSLIALLCLCTSLPAAELPATLFQHADDYGYMWWPYGWRGRAPDGHRVFCVQTNRYGLSFDVDAASLAHVGALHPTPSEDEALVAANDAVFSLPRLHLDVHLILNKRSYHASSVAPKSDDVRIIEHGRFLQRIEMLNLQFKDDTGAPLEETEAAFEIVCWPDRFSILVHLTPKVGMVEPRIELSITPEGDDLTPTTRSDDFVMLQQKGIETGGLVVLRAPGADWLRPSDAKTSRSPVTIASQWRGPLEKDATMTTGVIFLAHTPADMVSLPERARMELHGREDAAVKARGITPYRHPLESSHDPLRGWYRVDLGDHTRGGWTPQKDQNFLERVALTVQNPDDCLRTMRLLFARDRRDEFPGIIGMAPMLRDSEGFPTGLPVQISKNWHVSPPWFRGPTMLKVTPRTTHDLEFDIAYANWGGVPAVSHAQLCLVGWGVNQLWHQVAISSFGEVLCYDPDVNLNRAMIDDVRPLLVAPMGSAKASEPQYLGWTHNVGGGDFLVLIDPTGRRDYLSRVRSAYTHYGPNLAEVTYAGQAAEGAVDARMTVMHYRGDDITRGLYHLRYDCRKAVEFSRLAFFQLGADHYNNHRFRRIARGDESGMIEEWAPAVEGESYERRDIPCEGVVPWFSLHNAVPDRERGGAWANRGLIIRSWRARFGGVEQAHPTAGVYRTRDGGIPSVLVELTPPAGVSSLLPGDFVEAEIELVVLPMSAEDYRGPNQALRQALAEHGDTWRMVHREAVGNRLEVSAQRGRVERVYPTQVTCEEDGTAEVHIRGGAGFLPITFSGVRDYRRCRLEQRVNGAWTAVDQSVHGNDFWQADYHPGTGTWDLSFNVDADRSGKDGGLHLRLK